MRANSFTSYGWERATAEYTTHYRGATKKGQEEAVSQPPSNANGNHQVA